MKHEAMENQQSIIIKRIVLDTEFTALQQDTQLISLALVTDSGEKFYAVFNDFDKDRCNIFVKENVLPFLNNKDSNTISGNTNEIVIALKNWLSQFDQFQLQFWADVPHYDWVLFCELFGGSLKLPPNIHFMCLDIATLLMASGFNYQTERIRILQHLGLKGEFQIHNSLSDAELGMILLQNLLKI
jgi:hypothetical protein